MSWSGSSDGGSGRRGYHHGKLRRALVNAAVELINNKGLAGFTVAEAARLAGVSPAAPYRHFRDADALLAEVALHGFDRLIECLAAAWNDGRPDPISAFEKLGRAYLAFARDAPAYYVAMFDSRLAMDVHPALQAAEHGVLQILRDASERVAATVPKANRPPALMMALHIWSMAHGIAALFISKGSSRRKLPMTPEDLFEADMLLYLQSLNLFSRE